MKGFLLTGSVNTSTNHCTRAACPVALKHVKEIINVKNSYTGQFLKNLLENKVKKIA